MHTQIINGREVLTVPTVIGYKHYDLEKEKQLEKLLNLLIEEKTEQCTLSADHEQNEKKAAMLNSCLSDWGYQYEQTTKSPAWHAEQVGNSPKLLLKLYHECLEI